MVAGVPIMGLILAVYLANPYIHPRQEKLFLLDGKVNMGDMWKLTMAQVLKLDTGTCAKSLLKVVRESNLGIKLLFLEILGGVQVLTYTMKPC